MKYLSAFPYTNDLEILLRNKDMFCDYELKEVISYIEDKTILRRVANENDINTSICFMSETSAINALLLLDNSRNLNFDVYLENYNYAIKHNIELVCSKKLFSQLTSINPCNNISLLEKHYTPSAQYYTNKLMSIETPIISVLGLGEHCGKFETQILVNGVLKKRGFKALSLCTNELGTLFGMYSLPKFLFGNTYSFQDKILMFNNFVYDLCKKYEPDVLVLGFPGGITSFEEGLHNYFAEIPLVMSNAIVSDVGILCSYFTHRQLMWYNKNGHSEVQEVK